MAVILPFRRCCPARAAPPRGTNCPGAGGGYLRSDFLRAAASMPFGGILENDGRTRLRTLAILASPFDGLALIVGCTWPPALAISSSLGRLHASVWKCEPSRLAHLDAHDHLRIELAHRSSAVEFVEPLTHANHLPTDLGFCWSNLASVEPRRVGVVERCSAPRCSLGHDSTCFLVPSLLRGASAASFRWAHGSLLVTLNARLTKRFTLAFAKRGRGIPLREGSPPSAIKG